MITPIQPQRALVIAATACLMCIVARDGRTQSEVQQVREPHLPSLADMPHLREFSELAVSADGRWAAYTTSAPFRMNVDGVDEEGDDSGEIGRITLVDMREHRTKVLRVVGSPHSLRWSSRGATLAFLVTSHGVGRLWQYAPTDSRGAPQPIALTDSLRGSIRTFCWNAAGDTIAYLATAPKARRHKMTPSDARPPLVLFQDTPGEYTEPTLPAYAKDTVGAYVAMAALEGGTAHILARHVVSSEVRPVIEWSHAGLLLVSGAPIGVGYWKKITQRAMYTVDTRTRMLRQVPRQSESRVAPTWSPSGRWIAYLEASFLPDTGGPAFSHELQIEGTAQPRTRRILSANNDGLTAAFRPEWGADDSTLYIARYEKGTAHLFAVDVASAEWRRLTPDTLSVSRYALSRDGKILVAVLENANQPAELFRIDIASGDLVRLTREANMVPAMRLGHVDQVTWRSGDDRFAVHGFLVKPPDYDSTKRYPLVVQIHGGPGGFFRNEFVAINFKPQLIPPQLLAAVGYLVLLPNPRGDPSYGEAFQTAIRGDWGPGPLGDVNAGVSYLIARGLVDSTAVGIAGASYGAYLAAYAITQTPRFAAASLNDGPVNLVSEYIQNYATRAINSRWYFGGPPWSHREIYTRQSPITHVDHVRTPVIMRYGGASSTGDDIRQSYMLSQGLEFYAALRDYDVPVQFVLHPYQGHGINDWTLYEDWVLRNLRWFDYWLRHRGHNPQADGK